jgi:hypothetical protein
MIGKYSCRVNNPTANTYFEKVAPAPRIEGHVRSERIYPFAINALDNNLYSLIFNYNKAKPVVWQRQAFAGF